LIGDGDRLSAMNRHYGDRIYGEADWRTRRFALVDTGGIVPTTSSDPANILKQAGLRSAKRQR